MTRGIDHPRRDTMWEGDWEYILHDPDREAAAMDAAREEQLTEQNTVAPDGAAM